MCERGNTCDSDAEEWGHVLDLSVKALTWHDFRVLDEDIDCGEEKPPECTLPGDSRVIRIASRRSVTFPESLAHDE